MSIKEIIGNLLTFIIIVGCVIFIFYAVSSGIVELREHKDFVNQHIGKTVVVQNDTLLILNYQTGGWGRPSGFLLSNGTIINEEFVKTYEIY